MRILSTEAAKASPYEQLEPATPCRTLFVVILLCMMAGSTSGFLLPASPHDHHRSRYHVVVRDTSTGQQQQQQSLELSKAEIKLEQAFKACKDDLTKKCKVRVGTSIDHHRLGLIATQAIAKAEVILAMPFDERFELTGSLARNVVFKDALPDSYDGWTGDTGLIALLILNEVARASSSSSSSPLGTAEPKRSPKIQEFMMSWVKSLPSPTEMEYHPLMWPETDQEVLQSSSTNKIYRRLDDLEEDAAWLIENVFTKDRTRFPETVTLASTREGQTTTTSMECFTVKGFKWAMTLALSRSFFVDGCLRLIPFMDMCNHGDDAKEIQAGSMGTFGTTKGAQLVADREYQPGEEVFCSYGPKSAADYLLEHGFCPDQCWKSAVSELTFEVDPEDRFFDDKLDILEFETYDQAPMEPVQSFDVVSAPGRDGEPDPAMIQFVRLCKLGGTDAFLLESIFRKEVWGFMELPVSEKNELDVVNTIVDACQSALNDMKDCPDGGPPVCAKLRESESKALSKTIEYLQREKEALDLKEYYQERRLKDLGLDSEWSPEDDMSPDLGFGQTRAPGGADYDW